MRRDRLRIILDILDICNSGANKTKIVYQANLNFKAANIYIDILMNEGLLYPQENMLNIYWTQILVDFGEVNL
jgi:predicted transcriptional regulator